MNIELSGDDLQVLLTSLKYSKMEVENAQGTPESVRKDNLARIESVAKKLRAAGKNEGN